MPTSGWLRKLRPRSASRALIPCGASRIPTIGSGRRGVGRRSPGPCPEGVRDARRNRSLGPDAWRDFARRAGQAPQAGDFVEHGRSFAECAELKRRVPDLEQRTGNLAMPGFTAPKMLWVAAHEPEIARATRRVLLPKDYVRLRLSGEAVSEMSDASGTLWLDVGRRRWDASLLAATGLTEKAMPSLVEGSEVSAHLSPEVAAPGASRGADSDRRRRRRQRGFGNRRRRDRRRRGLRFPRHLGRRLFRHRPFRQPA